MNNDVRLKCRINYAEHYCRNGHGAWLADDEFDHLCEKCLAEKKAEPMIRRRYPFEDPGP